MKKKVLSLFVTFAMLFSMLPATALAAGETVAKIGETTYSTFSDAMTAANAMTGDVVVDIYGEVEFTNGMELNGSYSSITFNKGADGASITINQTAGGDYLEAHGKTVAFNNLTLAKANPAWAGNSGHMGNYFSIQGGTVTYTNCTFPNGACTSTGTATYDNCTFQNTSEYGLWVYDDALVTVKGGTINSAKGIKVYSEDETSVTSTLTVQNTTFTNNVIAKPAVAVGYARSITLIGNTYNNSTGVLELDSGSDADCEGITFVAKDSEGNDIGSTLTAVDRSNGGAACGVLMDGKIYTTVTEAVKDAKSGDTVTLLADVNTTESIKISCKLTIDLNGYTLAGTDTAMGSFGLINIQPDAELAINDTVGTGKITLEATYNRGWSAYSSVISNQRGKLTVNGGTIEHLGGTDMAYGIDNLTNTGAEIAETTINGGVIKSTYRAIRQFLNSSAEGVNNILTVNGGTIEGKNKSIWMQDANASANIGTLTVSDKATLVGDVYLFVTSGSTEWPVDISIADDAFADEYTVVTGNVPEGITVDVAGGYWGISNTSGSYAAAIGGIRYNTLADAINAAQPGDTVTLLTDITANSTVDINKSITLDGDDHKISGNASPLLTLNPSANITVQNATLEATNNVTRWNYVNEGYTHTYQNCQISGVVYGIHYDGNGGNVVIDGCTIDGFNTFAGSLARVTIKDTTFDAGRSGYAGANLWGNTVIENVTLVDEDAKTWLDVKTIAEVIGGKVIKDGAELSLESYLDAAAKIGTTYYNTLAAAVAVEGVSEITLVSDVNETVTVGKPLTIHLNGNEIAETVTAANGFTVAKGSNEWIFGHVGDVILVTGVALDKTTASIYVGNTTTLVATVTPTNATIDGITWSSNNESVATVDESGVVTGVAAGTATITATTENGGFAATCTVTVSRRPSGGGGGGSSSYTITVEDTKNGDITVSPTRASSGSTVTITVDPDNGYELDELTVLDKNGKEVELTKKSDSKYTFKMPSGKVTIEATFAEIGAEYENPFVDVSEGAYYYDAVLWAAENGITGGTSATTFSPAVTCTRAQTVTFLWRAAGSPDPEGTEMPFTDVAYDAYYYDAVLWAVENGITSGTSATTFSPDATVTRAQNVTFLWRWAEASAVETVNPFTDVAADMYYHDAVLWAADEGITAGTSATTFSPDDPCLRSQIVTFLYRFLAQ